MEERTEEQVIKEDSKRKEFFVGWEGEDLKSVKQFPAEIRIDGKKIVIGQEEDSLSLEIFLPEMSKLDFYCGKTLIGGGISQEVSLRQGRLEVYIGNRTLILTGSKRGVSFKPVVMMPSEEHLSLTDSEGNVIESIVNLAYGKDSLGNYEHQTDGGSVTVYRAEPFFRSSLLHVKTYSQEGAMVSVGRKGREFGRFSGTSAFLKDGDLAVDLPKGKLLLHRYPIIKHKK